MKRGKVINMMQVVTPMAICLWADAHPEELFDSTRFEFMREGLTANEDSSNYWWLCDREKNFGWRETWKRNGWEIAFDNGIFSCRKGNRKIFITK